MASYIYPHDLGTAPWNQNHMTFTARKITGARGGAGHTNGAGNAPAFGGDIINDLCPFPTGLIKSINLAVWSDFFSILVCSTSIINCLSG